MYCSDIWGVKQYEGIERVQFLARKKFLRVGLKSSNSALLGDCVRIPVFVKSQINVIKYWLRLLSLPEERWTKNVIICFICFSYSNFGKDNWFAYVRDILCITGFADAWYNQGVWRR